MKEVAKSNLEPQQHRFLASSANNLTIQPQNSAYTATGLFRKPRQPTKISRPKQNQSDNVRQFTSSKPEWYSTSYEN